MQGGETHQGQPHAIALIGRRNSCQAHMPSLKETRNAPATRQEYRMLRDQIGYLTRESAAVHDRPRRAEDLVEDEDLANIGWVTEHTAHLFGGGCRDRRSLRGIKDVERRGILSRVLRNGALDGRLCRGLARRALLGLSHLATAAAWLSRRVLGPFGGLLPDGPPWAIAFGEEHHSLV
jgi:hypothetical protein